MSYLIIVYISYTDVSHGFYDHVWQQDITALILWCVHGALTNKPNRWTQQHNCHMCSVHYRNRTKHTCFFTKFNVDFETRESWLFWPQWGGFYFLQLALHLKYIYTSGLCPHYTKPFPRYPAMQIRFLTKCVHILRCFY